jgi:four helix bundle protein
MNDDKTIRHFSDLHAWQEGHKLVLLVYKITKSFPPAEMFGLISQMKRCVVSVTSNIAEGFGRETYKEKVRFYFISRASAIELENQLLVALDVGYINNNIFVEINTQILKVQSILNGLIKKSKTFI